MYTYIILLMLHAYIFIRLMINLKLPTLYYRYYELGQINFIVFIRLAQAQP